MEHSARNHNSDTLIKKKNELEMRIASLQQELAIVNSQIQSTISDTNGPDRRSPFFVEPGPLNEGKKHHNPFSKL